MEGVGMEQAGGETVGWFDGLPWQMWVGVAVAIVTIVALVYWAWFLDRHERALPHWAPFTMQSPLMWEPMLDKSEVLTVLKFAGIEPPQLTRDGFPHANCGGGCIKAGIGQFAKLLEVRRSTFLEWEANEAGMREFLDKDIAILRDRRGGTSRPLTLTDLRLRIEGGDTLTDEERADMGACNCMTPPDNDEETPWFTA